MKNQLTKKTIRKWTEYCLINFPFAMKQLAHGLNKAQDPKNVLMYIFDNLDSEECRRLVEKFFFYQKVLDLEDSDFLPLNLKERLEKIFPSAEEKYLKLEISVPAANLPVREKMNERFKQEKLPESTFLLKQEIQETYLKEGTLYIRRIRLAS